MKTLSRILIVTLRGTTWQGYEATLEREIHLSEGQRTNDTIDRLLVDEAAHDFADAPVVDGGYLTVTRGRWDGTRRVRTRYIQGR